MAERLLLGLFAAAPGALAMAALLHLLPPAGLPSLAQRPLWLVWTLVGLWLALALPALLLRGVWLWRAALGSAAALLVAAALVGVAGAHPLASRMGLALAATALGCVALAGWIGARRLRAERLRPGRAAARLDAAGGAAAGDAAGARASPAAWLVRVRRGLGFWVAAVVMLECFRLAHVVALEPLRGFGMLGMLLVFFVLLPAASIAAWFPRVAAGLSLLVAAAFAGLAWRMGLWQGGAAALMVLAAAQVFWRPAPGGQRLGREEAAA